MTSKSPIQVSLNCSSRRRGISLWSFGDTPTHKLYIEQLEGFLFKDLKPLSQDLLEIAAGVFILDREVKRGPSDDVFVRKWERKFDLVCGVSDPLFWTKHADGLSRTLSVLTGDHFAFRFVDSEPYSSRKNPQLSLQFGDRQVSGDCIIPFSGGMDSGMGAAFSLHQSRSPILVSHSNNNKLSSIQKRVREGLKKKFKKPTLPQITIGVSRLGERSVEESQRSRAFLFLSLCAVVGYELGISSVMLFENGPVSINLPRTISMTGTTLSRSSHPEFVRLANELFDEVFESRAVKIVNPFLLKTRKDILQEAEQDGYLDLLELTVSCGGTIAQTSDQPHCGICSQCIDRRLATAGWRAESFDTPETYRLDPLTQPLGTGASRIMAESHGRFLLNIQEWNEDRFFTEQPYAAKAFQNMAGSMQENGDAVYALFKRYSEQSLSAVDSVLAKGDYQADSLTALVAGKSIPSSEPEVVGNQLYTVLASAIPKRYLGGSPKNEADLQDAMDEALTLAGVSFEREGPFREYAGVKTKTDFAPYGGRLWVEAKFPKDRGRVNHIITEITSRTLVNQQQGGVTLFFVYDPKHNIKDDTKFLADLGKTPFAVVRILR